eukprot:TRINITY_DN3042_c0_g1_i1.p3 TRINITY_DN3042_c0_g1~~TRINITY_DN3042_c0_g1_i1.p3  ORF type:complete len:178 (-),score=30.28 TRINITY_DN3042_c0_g1_i1:18-551(-)
MHQCVDSCGSNWYPNQTDQKCYKYENITINPELMIEEVLGQIPGSQTIYATCDQDGIIYYVASQQQNMSATTSEVIINKLQEADNTTQTDLGIPSLNPARSIYGSKLVVADQQATISIIGKLESAAKYYIQMYCANYDGDVSQPQTKSWIQASNKGCLLYTSPSPRDRQKSRMPSSA